MAQFWYDQQIRRYLLQFVRIFNGFQVQSGQKNAGGTSSQVYRTVPMRYADMSRLVAHVLRGNTENAINSTPFMTCHIANLNVARERRHDPKLVSAQQVQERKYDSKGSLQPAVSIQHEGSPNPPKILIKENFGRVFRHHIKRMKIS